jgi:catechol 2,3-dioxygenase-like lactoylglutathione lyase family enzyme
MRSRVIGLIPMARVVDVQRSIDFYGLLGMEVVNTFTPPSGQLSWAHIKSAEADLMLTRADAPIDVTQQGVLFYLYAEDLKSLREHLLSKSVAASEISFPFYMPEGETRVADPDGYAADRTSTARCSGAPISANLWRQAFIPIRPLTSHLPTDYGPRSS